MKTIIINYGWRPTRPLHRYNTSFSLLNRGVDYTLIPLFIKKIKNKKKIKNGGWCQKWDIMCLKRVCLYVIVSIAN